MAQLRFESGLATEAPVANLTERGVFVRIGAEIAFGEAVTVRLFGLELSGQVLFVSADPPGVVVGFDADLEARATLVRHLDDVEVLPDQGVEARDHDPWDEATAAGVTMDPDSAADPLLDDVEPAPLRTGDYAPVSAAAASASADEMPMMLDPALLAAAAIDDSVQEDPFAEPEPPVEPDDEGAATAEALEAVDVDVDIDIDDPVEVDAAALATPAARTPRPRVPSRAEAAHALASPVSSPDMPAATLGAGGAGAEADAAEADLSEPELPGRDWEEPESPTLAETDALAEPDVVLGEPEHPRVSGEFPAATSGLPVRSPDGMLLTPSSDLAEDLAPEEEAFASAIQASIDDAPAEDIDPADPVASLPRLDRDGFTVRFHSPEAYRTQLAHNLAHGGLVVQAGPMAVGTQRMLALVIPGQAAYTVSARVIFNDGGKLGFMLDSFALHKARLQTLAG